MSIKGKNMETRQIFLELKDKFQADLVLIQDNEARFQVYGSNLSQLVTELKLPQKVKNDEGPININLRSIDDIESHLIWNNHTYLLLKLYISDDKSPVNKKKYIVERATNSDAIGLEYDNRNNDGQYPKSHHIVHEVLTKNNSLELCQEQIDTLFEIDSWLKSDNPIAILDGRAGSGKTTLLKYVVSMLEKKKKTFK